MTTTIEVLTKSDLLQFKKDLIEEISKLFKEKPEMEMPEYLKSKQVRQILKCSDSTLQYYRDSGKLPYRKIASTFYYTKDGIKSFMDSSESNLTLIQKEKNLTNSKKQYND